jgi:integrase
MSLYKRGKNYHTLFVVNGTYYRQSLGTTDWREAQALEKKKIAQAEAGHLTAKSQNFGRLPFSEAADKYLASRKLELQPSSLKKEKQLLVPLKLHFGASKLNKINAEQVLDYREWRAATCGPAIINMEVGVLRRMLKRAKAWHAIAEDVKPLREPSTIGKALTPDEKASLLEAAALKPEWETAYFAAILALNTTCRGCELKGLRWSDIDLLADTLTIRKSKTEAGVRVIPLTPDAFEVLVRLRTRAELFGPVEPQHYVFARFKPVGRFNGREIVEHRMLSYDPTTPLGSWKKAWSKLTAKAGLPGLRFHDLRHHSITELAESGASEQTIKAIAGHVSQRMLDRYSHIRLEAKRNALEALSTKTPVTGVTESQASNARPRSETKSNVTNNVTKAAQEQPPSSQVIDSVGRRVGI